MLQYYVPIPSQLQALKQVVTRGVQIGEPSLVIHIRGGSARAQSCLGEAIASCLWGRSLVQMVDSLHSYIPTGGIYITQSIDRPYTDARLKYIKENYPTPILYLDIVCSSEYEQLVKDLRQIAEIE